MSTQPKIDDQFWFDLSFDIVKDSIVRLKEGASKLQGLLLWAFGIYTGSAIFTVEYKHIDEIGILLVLSLPYLLLLVGYWYAHIAQLPTTVDFDYRSPTLIEKAYIDGYKKSKRSLNIAKCLSFLGLFSLAISLMLAFIIKNQSREDVYLNSEVNKLTKMVLVTGYFPAGQQLEITVTSSFEKDSIKTQTDTILNSNSGLFYKNYPIDLNYKTISVEVGWPGKEYKHKILKEIKPT